MTPRDHLSYYPNSIEKKHKFSKQLKNTEGFKDYCLGKNEWFYKDEGNYGMDRNRNHLTEHERLERDYMWNEFNIWSSWKDAGKNIFDFSKELIDMLKETDVADTDIQAIKLPYSYFYIDLSEAKLPFANNSEVLIEGVYVYEEYNKNIDDVVTFEKVIAFNFTGPYIEHFKEIQNYLYSHVRGFHCYSLYLDSPYNILTVGNAVAEAKDTFPKVDIIDDVAEEKKAELNKIHNQFIDRTVKLTVNCLLYLTLQNKDIVEEYASGIPGHLLSKLHKAHTKRKKQVAEQTIINSGFTKIKFVGRSYASAQRTFTGEVSSHWRRGHWRNQRIGEDLKEIKLIWIKPTIVNKDIGEPIKGHIYTT